MTENKHKTGANESTLLVENIAPKRYWELDFLRGVCVLLMVIDHFFFHARYTLKNSVWSFAQVEFWQGLQRFASFYMVSNVRSIIRFVVIALFMLICGVSCTLSHNNALRGVKTLLVGVVITMFTYLADVFLDINSFIFFGVIHMLGCAMLLFSLCDLLGGLLQKLIAGTSKRYTTQNTIGIWVRKMLPSLVGLIGLIVFFSVPLASFEKVLESLYIEGQWVDFYYTELISDVSVNLDSKWRLLKSIFVEFDNYRPNSADYFPIMPYAFLVLIGSGIGQLVYYTKAKNALRRLDGVWNKPVNFVGRHALLFYLLHPVVIVAIFYIVGGIYYIA